MMLDERLKIKGKLPKSHIVTADRFLKFVEAGKVKRGPDGGWKS